MALRSFHRDEDDAQRAPQWPRPNPADWLTLQQAACELNVSMSTVRRMMRRGQLRNRIVPRRGGFRYLVYLPNSRHAVMQSHRFGVPAPGERLRLVDAAPAGPWRSEIAEQASPDEELRRLQAQVEHLSRALSRALMAKQTAPPDDAAPQGSASADPFGRFRWLARRRRRWWKF